jgi:putative ABC transport system permease protein
VILRAIHRKLLRDLWTLRGQVVTIALVVACGITSYVALRGSYEALQNARDAYFEHDRMGDVFVHAARVPDPMAARLAALPGVSIVYDRLLEAATLPVDFLDEPGVAEVVSLPDNSDEPPLGALFVTEGRMPDPTRDDEALILAPFATTNHLSPGDTLPAIFDGTQRTIRISGLAISPEYVFPIPPGGLSVDPHYTVLWMRRHALGAAFDLDGAFDDVVVRIQPGATTAQVIADIDRELAPYGGRGAVDREHQPSTNVLDSGLGRIQSISGFVPMLFLGVAAFLLNVVLARLVHLQRSQIAALKALGYTDLEVGLHYLELTLVVVFLGSLLGIVLGAWLGSLMAGLYAQYFHFPSYDYALDPVLAARAVIVSLVAGAIGSLATVRQVASLPPAEAMQPPAPPRYARSFLTGTPFVHLFETSGRMVLRELERRPMRTLLSSLGIAMAIAIFVGGRASRDGFNVLLDAQFRRAMREDYAVSFIHPVPRAGLFSLRDLPGVLTVEAMRVVPVRFRSGTHVRNAAIEGWPEHGELRQLLDEDGRPFTLPSDGLVLSRELASILGVRIGDDVTIDVLEGQRPTITTPVVGLVDDMLGLWGHMRLEALGRAVRDPDEISLALFTVDPTQATAFRARLEDIPGVASVVRREAVIAGFEDQNAAAMVYTTLLLTIFATTIAFGVVYNNARVALSVRSRDLASLRVLGLTRSEISAVLLGELAVQQVLAIPIGLALGRWFAHLVVSLQDPERFRLPEYVAPTTEAMAVATVVASGIVSALLVRRQLDRLDLVEVLKTRE